ncbi:MAG: ParB/RepB/Spo0J family partition protein, partial [Pseudomonadota bacterium]
MSTSEAGSTTGKPSFGDIPLACIRPSKTNPRKIFTEGPLNELADSIKQLGVAQPILVRPIEVIDGITYFEIVAGERRYRASIIAAVPTIPAIVRELSDRDAYEIQVLENLQRVDLHPLEEAEGFEALMKEYKATADELAIKVGKSKAYIYASLKLCELAESSRKAFYDGKLTKSTALLVARIPVKSLQQQCCKEITTYPHGSNPIMSTRDAAAHIERTYMLSLKKVAFKPSDASLIPDAGSCSACPKRTGNQPEVFADVNADVCTDSICYNAKGEAHITRIKQIAIASGQDVIAGPAAKKVYPNEWGGLTGGYVRIDDINYEDAKRRTYRSILGKSSVPTALLESPHSGKLIEVVKITELEPIMAEKGIKVAAVTTDHSAARERERAQELKAKLEKEYRKRLFHAVHHASLLMPLEDQDLRLVALQLFNQLGGGTIRLATVMALYGWTSETFAYPERAAKTKAAIDALTPAQLNQFVRDCTMSADLDVNTYTATSKDKPDSLLECAERAHVDAKAIRAGVDAEAKAKADSKKKVEAKKAAKAKPAPMAPTATDAKSANVTTP